MLATLIAGCGVKTVGDLESGSSESSDGSAEGNEGQTSVVSQSASDTDTATSDSGNDASASVSATVSATDPTATTTDPTDTDTDTGECPPGQGSTCDPQPELEPDDAAWIVDTESFEVELVDVTCIVADFQDDGTTMTIELHCDEEELAAHVFVLPHNPVTPLNLGVDTSVRLSYYVQTPFWTDRWFAIHRMDGGLVIGATDASGLLPADDLFAPLTLAVQDDICPQECTVGECGIIRRHAIDVVAEADEITVYDGTIGVVGQTTQYTVVAGEAAGLVDVGGCTDIPGSWYRVIVYDSSEG